MLDKKPEELQQLGLRGILAESLKLGYTCRKLLTQITIALILPLSVAIVCNAFLTQPLLLNITRHSSNQNSPQDPGLNQKWMRLLRYEIPYLLILLIFSLLSTAAVVYGIACVYAGKRVNLCQILSVLPCIWCRLMLTFLCYFLIIFVCIVVVPVSVALLLALIMMFFYGPALSPGSFPGSLDYYLLILLLELALVDGAVYISMVWNLASVVSVVEDSYGLSAFRKGMNLLPGKVLPAFVIWLVYWVVNELVQAGIRQLVVNGDGGIVASVFWGILLAAVTVMLNLVALLVQSVLYFVCKSYHHGSIDKAALSDRLEEYAGGYVLLKSNVQMEAVLKSNVQMEAVLDP